jgi:hypothetical protein
MSIHRYILSRTWNTQKRGVVNFIMLNPSTADDVFDDATIRRCVGFAKRWGFSGLAVTNLFAFRATDSRELERLAGVDLVRAIGEENDDTIQRCARHSDAIVCAWGNRGSLRGRDLQVAGSLLDAHELLCIRRSKDGNPVHPVREAYTDGPIPFMYKRIGVCV